MAETEPAARRRGRPPATDSADTRRAILTSARRLFADRGYAAVTNKELAAAAGITTGALYHYVESKLDLYVCVHTDLQGLIYDRFNDAVACSDTFIGKIEAILEAAHAMNVEDPTFARFIGAVRTDMQRSPEIAERLWPEVKARDRFFTDLVGVGVATGEIRPDDRGPVEEFIRVMLIGLTGGGSETPEQHRRAVDGIMAMFRGQLVSLPPTG